MIPGQMAAENNRALLKDAELRRIERAIRRNRKRRKRRPRVEGDRPSVSSVVPRDERLLTPPRRPVLEFRPGLGRR
jgi:hypothetical protein